MPKTPQNKNPLLLLFLFAASLKLWRSRLSRVMYSMANCLLLMKVGACVRACMSEISDASLLEDSQ